MGKENCHSKTQEDDYCRDNKPFRENLSKGADRKVIVKRKKVSVSVRDKGDCRIQKRGNGNTCKYDR